MELKMKPWVVVWTIVLLCVMPQSGRAQNKQLEKELKKEYKTKLKEYKKDGWKLDATSRSFEVILLQQIAEWQLYAIGGYIIRVYAYQCLSSGSL